MARIGYLQVELVTQQPFIISDPQLGSVVDKAVAMDSQGHIIVPVSGLIGSLRSHMASDADVDTLLGPGFGAADGATPAASALRALGSLVRGPDGLPITGAKLRRRTTTAIDAHRGAAHGQKLRTTEEAPAGSTVTLWCEHDGEVPQELIEQMRGWQPELGGGVGTGHGTAHVVALGVGVLDLTDPDDLAVYLRGVTPYTFDRVVADPEEVAQSPAEYLLDLRCQIVDPLLTAGGSETIQTASEDGRVSGANIRVVDTNDGQFLLEGSSIRGVLRARVAYIAASVYCANGATAEQAVIDGERVADAIFGSPANRGLVAVDTAEIHDVLLSERMHVAIDRFTGGAMPGLLFGDRPIARGEFQLRVRSLTADIEEQAWTTSLLLAACADVNDGLVGFGAMTSRGYGTVRFVAKGGGPPAAIANALPIGDHLLNKLRTLQGVTVEETPTAAHRRTQPALQAAAKSPTASSEPTSETSRASPAVYRNGRLSLIGKIAWSDLRSLVEDLGVTALWSGLGGIESARHLPASEPTGSHVWGWSDSLWLRARVDGDTCHVALLQAESAKPWPATDSIIERVTISRALPWSTTESRLSASGKSTMARLALTEQWTFTVGTWSPIMFLHAGAQPWR